MDTADPEQPSFAEHCVKLWRFHGPGEMGEVVELPSAGDCGYPGAAVEEDGSLRLAYYSQHETGRAGQWSATEPADIHIALIRKS